MGALRTGGRAARRAFGVSVTLGRKRRVALKKITRFDHLCRGDGVLSTTAKGTDNRREASREIHAALDSVLSRLKFKEVGRLATNLNRLARATVTPRSPTSTRD